MSYGAASDSPLPSPPSSSSAAAISSPHRCFQLILNSPSPSTPPTSLPLLAAPPPPEIPHKPGSSKQVYSTISEVAAPSFLYVVIFIFHPLPPSILSSPSTWSLWWMCFLTLTCRCHWQNGALFVIINSFLIGGGGGGEGGQACRKNPSVLDAHSVAQDT